MNIMDNVSLRTFFLLTYNSHYKHNNFEIHLWGVSAEGSPVKIIVDNFRPLFFVPRDTPKHLTDAASERKQLSLKATDNSDLDCLYFKTSSSCQQHATSLRDKGIRTYESDIYPVERYLMERMVKGGFSVTGKPYQKRSLTLYRNPKIRGAEIEPSLSVLSVDIETDATANEIYSIACCGKKDIVFIVGNEQDDLTVTYCKNEHKLLHSFINHVKSEDPDVIIGWNVINFDFHALKKRCDALSIPFEIGREHGTSIIPQKEGLKKLIAKIPGRIAIDVPVMLRAYNYSFQRYTLNHVASEMLGKSKVIEYSGQKKIEEINRQFREDKASLANYNLQDAKLTKEIFNKANLLSNAIERSKLSGHLIDRYGGSIAAFDYLYLPLLHREGYAAGNVADVTIGDVNLSGGYVLESKPGIYQNVLLLDFKSLYPTIIMTFMIDPLGAVVKSEESIVGPTGLSFSREKSILPGILADLMKERAKAKQTGNRPLSNAIKILMNSFYGVLGSPGCRFFSPDIAQAITGTGQYILKSTCAYIEQNTPYSILYGDTDSLFVLLGEKHDSDAKEIGNQIAADVNHWLENHIREKFNAVSRLELEFESHFKYFFMPTIRGSERGSKKRYCGAIEKEGQLQLIFKGLESARTDWTKLAKEFQQTLYEKIFLGEPVEQYIISTVNQVKNGEVDNKLVYQKQLRKPLDEYTTNIPPHAQAAKLLGKPERIIRYSLTIEGPQPIEKLTAPLDYEHYIETQLKPIADSILEWINLDFENIITGQQDLFERME